MANRRVMGGMGNRSGNRSYSQQPFQGNVNPWQGNNMSNNMNQGLMNQFSNPEQIALALTSLLQPQQQQQNPPSLLSLNAAPTFNQDRNLGGRFGNRGWSNFRRPEPYNKRNSGGGWRDQSGGNRNNNRGNRGGGGNKGKNNTPKKNDEKKNGNNDESIVDNNDNNETSEEKTEGREWKNERREEKDLNATDDSTAGNNDEKVKEKENKYAGIPSHLLHCFVCSKDMWDEDSFQKHVRGRAHKQMLDSLEESMSITVNILRETMRLAEEKKMIELNRIQRLNKKLSRKFSDIESHCNMCDFKFMGKIIAHRKSEGHQRLKRFLHPSCNMCSKEFPSRMEWVEHRLSPEHLRQLVKFMEQKGKNDGASVVAELKEEGKESDLDIEQLMEESTEQEDDFPIVEMDDDLHDLQNRIPGYRKTRLLASKSMIPFSGFLCQICNTSFVSEEMSNTHLKSKKHYLKFVEAIKNKYQKQQQEEMEKAEKEAKEEEEKAKKEDADESQEANESEMYDPEEACEEEQEKEDSEQNGDVSMSAESEEVVENSSETDEKQQQTRPKRSCNIKNSPETKNKRNKK